MQTYSENNILKYQVGKMNDVAMADGGLATSATKFFSLDTFEPQHEPEVIEIEDAEGNRSNNSHVTLGNRMYPFTFGATVDVTKIGDWLYYATGSVVSVQDGGTGAYEHVFSIINNVIRPKFTLFYAIDGEHDIDEVGYKRMKNCQINTFKVVLSQTTARFEGTGWGTEEDDQVNEASSVAITTVTDIEFQSATGLFRYSLSTTDLSTVANGDVLDTSGSSGISNSTNVGKFIIVNVDDAGDTVDVINAGRTDNTDDETTITGTSSTVSVVNDPVYAEPTGILLHGNACVAIDAVGGNFSTVSEDGLGEFDFELQHNGDPLFENPKSRNALEILSKQITTALSFDQTITTTSGQKAKTYKENSGTLRAFRFKLEDSAILLGSSVTHSPLLQIDINEALGIAIREGQQTSDNIRYAWAVTTSEQQAITFTLRNETATHPV